MANVTGWNELVEMRLFSAVVALFDTALAGWAVSLVFFVFQIILFNKTKSVALMWVSGFMFISLYATSMYFLASENILSLQTMFIVLVLELAVILYASIFKGQ